MKLSNLVVNGLDKILFYQRYISPLFPLNFEPSCSEYARQALCKYGPWKGGLLALRALHITYLQAVMTSKIKERWLIDVFQLLDVLAQAMEYLLRFLQLDHQHASFHNSPHFIY